MKKTLGLGIVIACMTLNPIRVSSTEQNIVYQDTKIDTELIEKIKLQQQQSYEKVLQQRKEILEVKKQIQQSVKKKLTVNTEIPKEWEAYLVKVSKEFGYDVNYLKAKIQQESSWNDTYISPTNDYGLCGINKCNFTMLAPILKKRYGKFDIFSYRQNIDSMIIILNDYKKELTSKLKRTPTEAEIETAYNRGVDGCIRYIASRGTADTTHYRSVKKWKLQYEKWDDVQ